MKTNTKTPKTDVEVLRKLGVRVSVHHDMYPALVRLKTGLIRYATGQTFVTLTTQDGREYLGAALCVDKNYDKKKGIHYALKLAYESIQLGKQVVPNWRELKDSEYYEFECDTNCCCRE